MFSQNLLYRYAHFRINLNTSCSDISYNCICSNKMYLAQQSRIQHEKICDDNILSDLIIDDDWVKLLTFFENAYIKNLKKDYKCAYDKIKHLRNKNFLLLLTKISDESVRMRGFLNCKTETNSTYYWSKLQITDFYIS